MREEVVFAKQNAEWHGRSYRSAPLGWAPDPERWALHEAHAAALSEVLDRIDTEGRRYPDRLVKLDVSRLDGEFRAQVDSLLHCRASQARREDQ